MIEREKERVIENNKKGVMIVVYVCVIVEEGKKNVS